MYSLRSRAATPQQKRIDFPVRKRRQEQKVTEENTSPSKKTADSKVSVHIPRKLLSTTPPKKEPLIERNCLDSEEILETSKPAFKCEKQVSQLQECKVALSIPNHMCRENEKRFLTEFLSEHIRSHIPGSLYISGPPGTGKTATLTYLLSQSKLTSSVDIVMINCMSVTQPQLIFKKIYDKLIGGAYSQNVERSIIKRVTTAKRMILLVLDEVDQLDTRTQHVLYSVFEWPSLHNSHLILISIANALDLTDRMLPRLQAHPHTCPDLLQFNPYTKDDIIAIIEDRLRHTHSSSVIDPMVIQFCARKVASVNGDVRKALDICRRAIELVETQEKLKKLKGQDSIDSVSPKVSLVHVSRVIDEVYRGVSCDNGSDAVPLQQKLVACALLLLVRGKVNKEVTLGKLYSVYASVCGKRQLKYESQSEFVSLINMLETRGVLRVKKSKDMMTSKVSLLLQESELSHALQDKTLISSVLQTGLSSQ